MGFLELAAAFKFVRAAELNFLRQERVFHLRPVPGSLHRPVRGVRIVSAQCLSAAARSRGRRVDRRAASALRPGLPLASALYLLPGMFKGDKDRAQKPGGIAYEWVQSFLLPDDRSDWRTDLVAAMAVAERDNKPLFIDFTGAGLKQLQIEREPCALAAEYRTPVRQVCHGSPVPRPVPAGVTQVPDAEETQDFAFKKLGNAARPYYVVVEAERQDAGTHRQLRQGLDRQSRRVRRLPQGCVSRAEMSRSAAEKRCQEPFKTLKGSWHRF